MTTITDLTINFGATGTPLTITLAEQVYTGMPVGFGSVTQSRWRSNVITVGGINFTLFPGIDTDGRVDCWIYAAYGEATAQQTFSPINREHASVDLQISISGVAQSLFGGGTTYSYNHPRSTWMRWQSSAMPWSTSHAFIAARIADGTFMQHDSRNIVGSLDFEGGGMPTVQAYQPFKVFSDIAQDQYIGDVPRANTGGGERPTIGPVHEWFARLVSEVGTNNNPAWLTATRLQILKDLAEAAGQFPHASGFLEPVTNRLLDPSVQPHCSNNNPAAWYGATGIPQPGQIVAGQIAYDVEYDNSHPFDKVSFHAYHLSKDPYYLRGVQGAGVCALTYQSMNGTLRGTDGHALQISYDQERGIWWGLRDLVQAWHATPTGTMPKPFRDKAWFATAANNSLQFIRDHLMSSTNHMEPGIRGEAMRFWRAVGNMGAGNGEFYNSHFQEDYGHIVMAQALLLGFSSARDVAEWRVVNIQRRIEAGGSWFLNDYELELQVNPQLSAYALSPATGFMPYTDVAGYKAWYPRKTLYTNGPTVTADFWHQQFGRDTYLFLGAVNITKEAVARGLLTAGFDVAAAETELRARFVPPYYQPNSTQPLNYATYAKQYFSYTGTTTTPPTTGITMTIADLVKETTTNTTTTTITLAGAVSPYRSFASGFTVGATNIPVFVRDTLGNFESGRYTLTNAALLTRTAITSSSNADAAVTFPAGVKDVYCDLPAISLARMASVENAVVTTIADTTVAEVFVNVGGVPYRITMSNLMSSIGTAATALPAAGTLAGADIMTINQSGSDVKTTLTAIAAAVATINGGAATVPATMAAPTATAGNTTASVVMVAPSNGGSAITGYTVTSIPAGGVDSNAGSTSLTHTITGLTNGTAYTFTAKATNSVGTAATASPASNSVTPSASATAPATMAAPTATAGNTTASVVLVAPADGGSAITGYTVTSIPAGGVDSNAGTTALTHTITGLTNGTAYTFTAKATNAVGTAASASPASNSVTPAVPATGYILTGPPASAATFDQGPSNITTNGYVAQNVNVYVKDGSGNAPAETDVKFGWGTSATVSPFTSGFATTQINGQANSVFIGQKVGGWVNPGDTYYGLFTTAGTIYAWGAAGNRYLWAITADGASVVYKNGGGSAIAWVVN